METQYKEGPILFSTEMVKAILDGRKTQTRRIVNPQLESMCLNGGALLGWNKDHWHGYKPKYRIGNRLWVRETWQLWQPWGSAGDEWIGDDVLEYDGKIPKQAPDEFSFWRVAYKADCEDSMNWWRPSIFMPRWASRITLEIVNVRVERLQNIDEDDAQNEGIPDSRYIPLKRNAFRVLWDSLNAKRGYGWNVNPWVWVIEFKRTV